METYIKIIILSSLFFFSSCDSWLDLKPETQVTEEELFNSGDGYRASLNGLYKAMGTSELYGREMAFGMVDCISQQYRMDYGSNIIYDQKYVDIAGFNYSTSDVSALIENTWRQAFNVIANANNLIQNVTMESPDLFAQGEMEKNLIIGEAYACRALMHFDMLRLFAPAPVNDDGNIYVPYVENYPNITASPIAVKPFLDKVIHDLEYARTLVAEWDTCNVGVGTLITGKARFYNTFSFGTEIYDNSNLRVENFFKGRGYRLNYYAITALLARVCQYADQGQKAFEYAEEVMDFEVKDYYGWQKAFAKDDFSGVTTTNWNSKSDLKIVSNLVFAVYNEKAYTDLNLSKFFIPETYGSPTWLVINKEYQKIFETRTGTDESALDYRSLNMVFYGNGQYPLSGKWYYSENESVRDNNVTILPVIRATEMRYIMAEYYARQGNFAEARNILTDIRARRGCSEAISISNWAEFEEELIRDARREWISEGQLFYLYKRLNAAVNFGRNVIRPLSRAEYLLPVPSNESL